MTCGCAEQAEEDAGGEVTGEAEREADDGVDVEAEAGCGDVEDDDHPEGEDAPGEEGQHRDAAGGGEIEGSWRLSRRWGRWREPAKMGKMMMRATSSPAPPLRRKALRKMHQRSRARAANWARLWAVVQGLVCRCRTLEIEADLSAQP